MDIVTLILQWEELRLPRLINSRLEDIKSSINTDVSGSKASVLGFITIL